MADKCSAILMFGGELSAVQDRLVASDHDIYLFISREDMELDHCRRGYKRVVALNSRSDTDYAWEIVRMCDLVGKVIRCASVDDDYHAIASTIAERLGLPFRLSRTCIDNMKNKETTRGIANALSPRPIAYALVEHQADLEAFVRAPPGSLIVKPRHGTGSRSIFCVEGGAAFDPVSLPTVRENDGGWVAEQFIEGREYSVESLSAGGRHLIVGVTEKMRFKDSYVERAHVFPAQLANTERDRIVLFVSDLLSAVGLQDGPAHTEVMVNAEGVFLIETQARMGGDWIWRLIGLVTGLDETAIMARLVLDGTMELPTLTYDGVAEIEYRHFHGDGLAVGALANVRMALDVKNVVDVLPLLPPGTPTRPLNSSFDRSYLVITHAADRHEADRAMYRAHRLLRYELYAFQGD